MRKFGFSFSWKRALGISAAKGKLSRAIGIPLTKSGRQRKAGRVLGNLVGTALVAGSELGSRSSTRALTEPSMIDYGLIVRAIRPRDTVESVCQMIPGLSQQYDERGILALTDGLGLKILAVGDRVYALQVRFVWAAGFNAFVKEVATHLSIPADAHWEGQFPDPDSGSWTYGDNLVTVALFDQAAYVSVASSSMMDGVAKLQS